MKKTLSFLFVGLFSWATVQSQTFTSEALEDKIDALIPEQVNDTTPGVVVGIVQNGALIFSKGYGLANLSYGIPNDPKMVYNTGSVSKQFLGYAFAILHEEGVLHIDDPVTDYLEDWPEFDHVVTLRHLLTHTSGYREAYTMSNLAGRLVGVDRLTREECLNVIRRQPELEFVPGSRYTYNSTAWVVLAEVFEKVMEVPANEWVEANLLAPLGMSTTQIEASVGEVIRNAAESYSLADGTYINEKSNRAIFGAAEVCASIEDLAKWVDNFRTATVGGANVRETFLNPFILNSGTNAQYGLGIGNGSYRGVKRYRHTGGHEAFLTQLDYFPDQDLGIITISNFGRNGWFPTSSIADLLLEEHLEPNSTPTAKAKSVKRKELEKWEGQYLISIENRVLNLAIVDDVLTIDGRQKMIPTSKSTFTVSGQEGEFVFSVQEDGSTKMTTPSNFEYKKVAAWSPSLSELEALVGDYWSDELETVYHVEQNEGELEINHRWLGSIPLDPITKDFFRAWGFFVRFKRDNQGAVSGLAINSGRTLNVNFGLKK